LDVCRYIDTNLPGCGCLPGGQNSGTQSLPPPPCSARRAAVPAVQGPATLRLFATPLLRGTRLEAGTSCTPSLIYQLSAPTVQTRVVTPQRLGCTCFIKAKPTLPSCSNEDGSVAISFSQVQVVLLRQVNTFEHSDTGLVLSKRSHAALEQRSARRARDRGGHSAQARGQVAARAPVHLARPVYFAALPAAPELGVRRTDRLRHAAVLWQLVRAQRPAQRHAALWVQSFTHVMKIIS